MKARRTPKVKCCTSSHRGAVIRSGETQGKSLTLWTSLFSSVSFPLCFCYTICQYRDTQSLLSSYHRLLVYTMRHAGDTLLSKKKRLLKEPFTSLYKINNSKVWKFFKELLIVRIPRVALVLLRSLEEHFGGTGGVKESLHYVIYWAYFVAEEQPENSTLPWPKS